MSLEGTHLGHYQLLRRIGSGGMGEVYLAEDTHIMRQVAIKVIQFEPSLITPDTSRLFQREMKAIAGLNHPHILSLFDAGEEVIDQQSISYMVMPYFSDGSLSDWLRQRGNMVQSLAVATHIIDQAAAALHYAHGHQLIHQDVKPSNFLIRQQVENPSYPDLLLADFGIAKMSTATALKSQSIRGTPAYMAPEQWRGQSVTETDQYALAVMAYELLIGHPPFVGTLEQVMHQHFTVEPKAPSIANSFIPLSLDAVILRGLAKKPEDRWKTILQFAQAFRQAQAVQVLGDVHITLDLSSEEANRGTTRIITLSSGREISIVISPAIDDRQESSIQTLPSSGQLSSTPAYQQADPALIHASRGLLHPNLLKISVLLLFVLVVILSGIISVGGYRNHSITTIQHQPSAVAASATTIVDTNAYPSYLPMHGTLVLRDSLEANSKSQLWGETTSENIICAFSQHAYYVKVLKAYYFYLCGRQSNFTDSALEVQMRIIQGDCGGIGFHVNTTNSNIGMYKFDVCSDGTYMLKTSSTDKAGNEQSHLLASDSSTAIYAGLKQVNVIGIAIRGGTITLYANGKQIAHVNDNTFRQGFIGFIADAYADPTEVAYQNVRVWTF